MPLFQQLPLGKPAQHIYNSKFAQYAVHVFLFKCLMWSEVQQILQGELNAWQMNSSKPMALRLDLSEWHVCTWAVHRPQGIQRFDRICDWTLVRSIFLTQKPDSLIFCVQESNCIQNSFGFSSSTFTQKSNVLRKPFDLLKEFMFFRTTFSEKQLHDIRGLTIATWIAGFGVFFCFDCCCGWQGRHGGLRHSELREVAFPARFFGEKMESQIKDLPLFAVCMHS